jgi:hypothetical protein
MHGERNTVRTADFAAYIGLQIPNAILTGEGGLSCVFDIPSIRHAISAILAGLESIRLSNFPPEFPGVRIVIQY